MKIKASTEVCIYFLVIILSLAAILMILCSPEQFRDVKIVYQIF